MPIIMPSEKPNPSEPHPPTHIRKPPMPTEIRITYSRLKMFVMSLVLLAIAAAASPLLFVGSLKSVLSGAFIVLFCLVFAALLLYHAADSRTKLVLNADGIRIVQAFTEEELDGVGAKSGSKTKRENVFYPWEQINSVVFVYPFPATLYLNSEPARKFKAELEELEAEQPLPDNATLEQMEARVAKYLRLSESMTRQRDFSITLPVMYLLHGKHLPDLICTLAAEPDKSRRQAVLDGFCQTFFPKALGSRPVAPPEPREFPVCLPTQVSIRSIGGGYPLANILCALMLIGSLVFAAVIVRNAADPADIRGFLPLLPFAVITAAVAPCLPPSTAPKRSRGNSLPSRFTSPAPIANSGGRIISTPRPSTAKSAKSHLATTTSNPSAATDNISPSPRKAAARPFPLMPSCAISAV